MIFNIPNNLPAIKHLEKEGIHIQDQLNVNKAGIQPLKVLILNLMPVKETTETDFVRLLTNSPLAIDVEFVRLNTHKSKNTSEEHLNAFYKKFSEVQSGYYDGLIVTGAPVENYEYKDVTYWNEISHIIDWARTHVTSTLHICWAAQAALFHQFGIPKYALPQKKFGVFKHTINTRRHPIVAGFDDEFYIPHSRHTEIRKSDIVACSDLEIVAESPESGVGIIIARGGREIYLTGHSEYPYDTLHNEYTRDLNKGLLIQMPLNYYKDDHLSNGPSVRWRAHANLLFCNWLHNYVYMCTPSNKNDIEKLDELPTINK